MTLTITTRNRDNLIYVRLRNFAYIRQCLISIIHCWPAPRRPWTYANITQICTDNHY